MIRTLLARMTVRHVWRHRWQSGLAIIGVALGVAVVVAVELTNQSARHGFDLSMKAVSGGATHHIVGNATGFDETYYRDLRLHLGVRRSAPIVEGYVQFAGRKWRLLGVDPLVDTAVRGRPWPVDGKVIELLRQPGAVYLSERESKPLDLAPGQGLTVLADGKLRRLHLVGTLSDPNGAMASLILTDISTAQEVLDRVGRLDRIDLVLNHAQEQQVRKWLPPQLTLVGSDKLMKETGQLTRVFYQNLTAMSLLALVVGAYLVYNTMVFSVLRRRQLIGTLRLLGVTRRQVMVLVLCEAAVVGIVGTLLGTVGGFFLAQKLLALVTRTINDLYFVLAVSDLSLGWLPLAEVALLGIGFTMMAAWVPALEAARISPVEARRRTSLERNIVSALPWLAGAGVFLMGSGAVTLAATHRGLVSGFGGLVLLIVGFSMMTPPVVHGFATALDYLFADRLHGFIRLAARGLAAGLSRSGIAVAALAVALSATVGIGVMISSLRTTVVSWLDQTLQSDIYVSAPSAVSSRVGGSLLPAVVERVPKVAGVAAVRKIRRVEVRSGKGPVDLLAMQWGDRPARGFRFKNQSDASVWRRISRGEIGVSETFAYRNGLAAGDNLVLLTSRGPRAFRIGGVFYDYASTRGLLVMSLAQYRTAWADKAVSSLGLYLKPGIASSDVTAALQDQLSGLGQKVEIKANGDIRDASLNIFDRTFAITDILRLLAVGVAFVGILSALMALQLERAREHAVLRATGVTPGELFGLVSLETSFMGLAAGVLSLPLGLTMAEILIGVINRRSFGWTMETVIPPALLVQAVGLALAAALFAGIYPAWKMAHTSPAEALREE